MRTTSSGEKTFQAYYHLHAVLKALGSCWKPMKRRSDRQSGKEIIFENKDLRSSCTRGAQLIVLPHHSLQIGAAAWMPQKFRHLIQVIYPIIS
jgi:hypothetical protein